jgi:hemerythrin-like metal-binding protein
MISTNEVFFPWKPEYSVHDSVIDDQHRQLVALINDLYVAMAEGQGHTAVEPVLTRLTIYIRTHFWYEENKMERLDYPATMQHKEDHRKLLQQVELYVKGWSDHQSVSVLEIATFLKYWLSNHIGQTDRALAQYLTTQIGTAGSYTGSRRLRPGPGKSA